MELTKKILIADSSEEFAQALKENLELVPEWDVIGLAHDGQQAVDLLEEIKVDVLLLDLLLPKLDGIAVLRKASEQNPAPVSMVLSG